MLSCSFHLHHSSVDNNEIRTDATEGRSVGGLAADSVADVRERGQHTVEKGVGSALGSLSLHTSCQSGGMREPCIDRHRDESAVWSVKMRGGGGEI